MKYSDLDILELNHICFTNTFEFDDSKHRKNNLQMSFVRLCYVLLKSIIKCKFNAAKVKNIIFLSETDNQKKALEPIEKLISKNRYSIVYTNSLPMAQVYLYSLLYFKAFLRTYRKASQRNKNIMMNYSNRFLMSYGLVSQSVKLIENNKVDLIIMSNDHNPMNRCLLYASKIKKVKTIYTQHASASDVFPSLQFTYSFLDGEDSLEKYVNVGNLNSHIYLAGSPRFDIANYSNKKDNEVIGIAFNTLDDEEKIKQICAFLKKSGFNNLIVRSHPAIAHFDIEWYKQNDIKISNSHEELSFEFLKGIKFLISGESGIHLDAAIMGISSVLYNMTNGSILDIYKYVANGLINVAQNEEALLSFINNKNYKASTEKVQWYNAAYNRNISGHIGEMIADFIGYIQRNEDISNFDKKYSFTKKIVNGYEVKVYGK